MIKRLFMTCLALFFPWIVLLIEDNPGGALVALIMQASVIGWIPASLWALRTAKESRLAKAEAAAEERRAEAESEAQEKAVDETKK